jgi:hypothetical protein
MALVTRLLRAKGGAKFPAAQESGPDPVAAKESSLVSGQASHSSHASLAAATAVGSVVREPLQTVGLHLNGALGLPYPTGNRYNPRAPIENPPDAVDEAAVNPLRVAGDRDRAIRPPVNLRVKSTAPLELPWYIVSPLWG